VLNEPQAVSPREDIIVCDAKQSRYGAKKTVSVCRTERPVSRDVLTKRAPMSSSWPTAASLRLADVGRSRHDVPGFHAAEAYRRAQSMDRAEMSPVCGSKDTERSDVSTAGHLRRQIV